MPAVDAPSWSELERAAQAIDSGSRNGAPMRLPAPQLPPRRRLTVQEQWASLIWSIDSAEAQGVHALRGVAVALSRIIVGQGLEALLLDAREFRGAGLSPANLLWDPLLQLDAAGGTLSSLPAKLSRAPTVDLIDTIVLPNPWERWRLHTALQNLGAGRAWGAWRQDRNHHGVAWRPWPIVWVSNGNHSTTAALLRGGGRFKCREAFDFTPVLAAVYTDGLTWLRACDGSTLAPVRSIAMAGIFVIGQRLAKLDRALRLRPRSRAAVASR